MITLNTEKGLVRIESWDDILTRPGFTSDVDPRAVKLHAIIGNYLFKTFITCGLSTCHQPHGSGYLVVTKDGRETNIGKDCGKTHFSVDFVQMRRTFDRDVLAQERRERLWALKNRLPSIKSEIDTLKSETYGANWVYTMTSKLQGTSGGLPLVIVEHLRKLIRTGSGELTIERAATQQEIDIADASGQRRGGPLYFTDRVGFIEGFSALLAENGLRSLLIDSVEPAIKALDSAEIDLLGSKELSALSRLTKDLDNSTDRLKQLVLAGRRLLVKQNISQLSRFAISSQDKRSFADFLNSLP